jgi:hypothetical protein
MIEHIRELAWLAWGIATFLIALASERDATRLADEDKQRGNYE